jgi:hypothetical protein
MQNDANRCTFDAGRRVVVIKAVVAAHEIPIFGVTQGKGNKVTNSNYFACKPCGSKHVAVF